MCSIDPYIKTVGACHSTYNSISVPFWRLAPPAGYEIFACAIVVLLLFAALKFLGEYSIMRMEQ